MMLARRIARRGFTLLELAIVLGIIALVAGAGMKMASGSLKAADRVTTQERLSTIKAALDSFTKTYGYLPCPANRTLLTTSTSFGVEARAAGATVCTAAGSGVVLNDGVWFGAVPVRTLGLPDYYAADAWGNKFDYDATVALVANPASYADNIGNISIRYGTLSANYIQSMVRTGGTSSGVSDSGAGQPRITLLTGSSPPNNTLIYMTHSTYKGSYYTTYVSATEFDLVSIFKGVVGMNTIEWQLPLSSAAYAVVSHGPDGRGAYPLAGSAIPGNKRCNDSAAANSSPAPCTSSATMSCIDIENCNGDANFYDTAYNDGTQASLYFDDYIVWGSNDLQRTPVNNTLYTSCPATAGACEAWCATCGLNYPGGVSASPPPAITSNAFLYKKVLNTSATNCNATCFWGGNAAAVTATCPTGSCYVAAP